MRSRDRVLQSLENVYRAAFGTAEASGDAERMEALDMEYQRDQLQLEVLLDIRDLLRPGDEDSADRTDSRRRRHIDGLIENNPAVDRLSRTSTTSHRHLPHQVGNAKLPTHAGGRRSSRRSRSDRRTQKTAAA